MKFKLDNGFLAYNRIGTGIPLLLIHGYPLSRKIWLPQVTGLSTVASVISFDLRGHGDSYPFAGPYSMDMLADDCKLLLDDLHINIPIIVCGLSMGGYVTMALYRKYPGLFAGMILTSTRSGADSTEGKANRDVAIKNAREKGVPFIADGMLPKMVSPLTLSTNPGLIQTIRDIMLETSVNGVEGALQGMRDRPDSTPLISQISCPVLILHGADDQLIPVSEAELMSQKVKNSRLVVLPEAGHLLNMEQPDKFNRAVQDFIPLVQA